MLLNIEAAVFWMSKYIVANATTNRGGRWDVGKP